MPTPATCTRYDEESEDESPFKCPSLSDDDSSLEARSGKNQCIEADTSDDDEDNDSDLEAEMVLQQIKGRGKKRKKAAGRKSTWPLTALMELTDVICSSERLKRELIFTNTRNKKNSEFYGEVRDELATRYADRGEVWEKSINQMRYKFKSMVAFCKKKALARITESGIANVIQAKGEWFKTLFPLVQSRESADPDNGREPSYEGGDDDDRDREVPILHENQTEPTSSKVTAKSFVPTRPKSRKQRKEEILVDAIKTFQENSSGGSRELVEFLEKDNKENREHEQRMMDMQMKHQREMFQMLMSMQRGQQSAANMTWPNISHYNNGYQN